MCSCIAALPCVRINDDDDDDDLDLSVHGISLKVIGRFEANYLEGPRKSE